MSGPVTPTRARRRRRGTGPRSGPAVLGAGSAPPQANRCRRCRRWGARPRRTVRPSRGGHRRGRPEVRACSNPNAAGTHGAVAFQGNPNARHRDGTNQHRTSRGMVVGKSRRRSRPARHLRHCSGGSGSTTRTFRHVRQELPGACRPSETARRQRWQPGLLVSRSQPAPFGCSRRASSARSSPSRARTGAGASLGQ